MNQLSTNTSPAHLLQHQRQYQLAVSRRSRARTSAIGAFPRQCRRTSVNKNVLPSRMSMQITLNKRSITFSTRANHVTYNQCQTPVRVFLQHPTYQAANGVNFRVSATVGMTILSIQVVAGQRCPGRAVHHSIRVHHRNYLSIA